MIPPIASLEVTYGPPGNPTFRERRVQQGGAIPQAGVVHPLPGQPSPLEREHLEALAGAVDAFIGKLRSSHCFDPRPYLYAIYKHSYSLLMIPVRRLQLRETISRVMGATSESDRFRKALQRYLGHPDVNACFNLLFRFSLLGLRYSINKYTYDQCNGIDCDGHPRYGSEPSLAPPSFYCFNKLSFHLRALLESCAQFEEDHNEELVEAACKKYAQHWQQEERALTSSGLEVLSFIILHNIIERSDVQAVYQLTTIAHADFIPYKYRRISQQEIKDARNSLRRTSNKQRKSAAYRRLLHARIPWDALYTLGSLLHASGDISPETAQNNRDLVQDQLPKLIPELEEIHVAIQKLSEFERSLCQEPFSFRYPGPKEVQQWSFEKDYVCLSDLERRCKHQTYLPFLVRILESWNKLREQASHDISPLACYAFLRIIQILGELTKALCSQEGVWKWCAHLRDKISHCNSDALLSKIQQLNPHDWKKIDQDLRAIAVYFEKEQNGENPEAPAASPGLEILLKAICKKDISLSPKEGKEHRDPTLREKALQKVEIIRNKIKILQPHLPVNSQLHEQLKQHPIFRLACQYFLTDLRDEIKKLLHALKDYEDRLPLDQQCFPQHKYILQVEDILRFFVATTNGLCHVHQVTEVNSLTFSGEISTLFGVLQLLVSNPFPDVETLDSQLADLQKML